MRSNRTQALLESSRIIVVVLVALLLGFILTLFVSDEPVNAYREFLTGPFPRISFDGGFQIKGLNRFGNWIEESITLILLGLSISIVFRARQFSLGAEGQLFMGALAAGIAVFDELTEAARALAGLAAAEARHGCLFNQATQLDTLADSCAFATLPLPSPSRDASLRR